MRRQEEDLIIIELIKQGKGNKQIAEEIHLSHRTVEGIISRLMKRNDCKNRAQLAVKFTSNNK